ncbi:uncharacterized protein LOC125947699 [Dermacentor silvarum]|uniref:uncharacterized protein LOC125947699 n=1 Tax=Dermacentor silvarum TaxID=543639 RepID=UPI002101B273|nr:uncharacterized protein LOC125947699 [Dermacentor silvarum]
MEEAPLTSPSLSSRRSLIYESGERTSRGSQHSLRKHRAQVTEKQPDEARCDQSSARNTDGVATAKSSGSLQLLDFDNGTFERSREGLPLSRAVYRTGRERTPPISQDSLQGAGHGRGRSLHDVRDTVRPFVRSAGAIHVSKVSSGTQCGSAKEIHGETEQLSLQRQPDSTDGIRRGLRSIWQDWFQTPYLWYMMMAIMAVLLVIAVGAVFLDLQWAAQLVGHEQLTLADWQEPHHMDERDGPVRIQKSPNAAHHILNSL